MSKPFVGISVGTGQIDLTKYEGVMVQMKPVAVYHKSDGDLNNKDSLCIVMSAPDKIHVCGQISVEMFNDGLKDIGWKLQPI